MSAQWIQPSAPDLPLQLQLDGSGQAPRDQVEAALADRLLQHGDAPGGALVLHTGPRSLGATGLAAIRERLAEAGFSLNLLVSSDPPTRVAAAALGLAWQAPVVAAAPEELPRMGAQNLTLHRGTVRAGDQLEAEGSLLVLGDVNPGARVQAGGHVLVWGRLRGVAHAGCNGDTEARIVAMQLCPVQLRIADVVARGPEEPPPPGLAEEARLVSGVIRIDAASPVWPLSG
jgi:septum site-determining protein MinC